MRVTSTRYNDRPAEASRPFDRGRDGFVLGEGAWLMTLEREDRARERGARIYATVDGYGSTCDAYHRVQMDPEGTEIVRAMSLATDARRTGRIEEIGYVNYHGTSTVLNDRGRGAMRAPRVRPPRRAAGRVVDQVDDRPSAGRERRGRRGDGRAGDFDAACCRRRSTSRIRIRSAISTSFPTRRGRGRSQAALCNCLGFGSKNSALVIGRA